MTTDFTFPCITINGLFFAELAQTQEEILIVKLDRNFQYSSEPFYYPKEKLNNKENDDAIKM